MHGSHDAGAGAGVVRRGVAMVGAGLFVLPFAVSARTDDRYQMVLCFPHRHKARVSAVVVPP